VDQHIGRIKKNETDRFREVYNRDDLILSIDFASPLMGHGKIELYIKSDDGELKMIHKDYHTINIRESITGIKRQRFSDRTRKMITQFEQEMLTTSYGVELKLGRLGL